MYFFACSIFDLYNSAKIKIWLNDIIGFERSRWTDGAVCRGVLRAHRAALQSQRHFWKQLLRDSIPFDVITGAFREMEESERVAEAVYKRCGCHPLVQRPTDP